MTTITCLWIQNKLDDISITCVNSWLKLGYKIDIYTYSIGFRNEWINTKYDDMVNVKDANEILNDKVDINKLEFKADLFRFRLFAINKAKQFIERIIWLDTDQYLIRKIPTDKNYVSSQSTLNAGAFKHKDIREMPNIGVMSFDGNEDIDWKYIIDNGMKYKKNNELQSSFLKYYEKIMIKTDYAVEPNVFCPIHWAWSKEIYTKNDVDPTKYKYGLKPVEYVRLKNNEKVLGIHLWRQLFKKNNYKITNNSIYNTLKKHSQR